MPDPNRSEYLEDVDALAQAEARAWERLAARARTVDAERVGRTLDMTPLPNGDPR